MHHPTRLRVRPSSLFVARITAAIVLGLCALAGLTLAPRAAHAQASYRLAPVGGRTTLVGGTGVVFGRDTGGTFLNPATAVRIDKNRLSFAVDFYNLSLIRSSSWYQPGTIDKARFGDVAVEGNSTAVSSFDFDSLPGSLCLFFGVGDLPFLAREASKELRDRKARLGVCLASTIYNAFTFNAEDYEQRTPTGVSRQAHNFRQTFRRISVGPTYSMHVDNHLAIGASIHASRSSHRSIIGATSTTYGGDMGPVNSMLYRVSRGDSHELTATIGATYRLSKRQSVGLAISSPSLHLFGSGGINHQTDFRTSNGGDTTTLAADGPFVTRTPPRVSLGTGIEASWGSVELNAMYSAPLSAAYSADFEGRSFHIAPDNGIVDQRERIRMSVPALGVVNFGVGGEVFTSPRISLLGGISTDASIAPKGAMDRDLFNYYPSRMHRIATSFGVGSHGEGGDLLIGTELSYGWGDRLTPNSYQMPPRLDRSDQQVFGFLFVLAGSTSFRTLRRAVEDVKKALDPEADKKKDKGAPTYNPLQPKPAPSSGEPTPTIPENANVPNAPNDTLKR